MLTKPSSLTRSARWTALPSHFLCMASPLTHKNYNNKSAAVGDVNTKKEFISKPMKYLLFLLLPFLFSCQNKAEKSKFIQSEIIEFEELNWAKNFRYAHQESETLVQLLEAGEIKQEFVLSAEKPKYFETIKWIQTPVKSIASASCVYTKMIEVLGGLEYIKGVDQKAFYFDEDIILESYLGLSFKCLYPRP